ncbi:c-type cytochrome domain-containing protein [Portibacter marinus]|uniref:c-type cytochrome domain-containing protein n=1 Tax=Portibacter marinus TaxID=2898660 RepID=UPI001F3860D4|nr:c-type cytochrome domain-containing protein [Portibacter marinus]
MEFDFSIFVGRFHPLFVHLPIGIIIVTLVLEVIGKAGKNTLAWLWFFSFATALFSIFTGWQLTQGSSYPQDSLFWHKWLGITVAAISAVLWLLTAFTENYKHNATWILKGALAIILSIGGHIGGQLTHGNDYLVEAAPGFIKNLAGYDVPKPLDLSNIQSDSIVAYQHLIYPVLEQKCVQCHNQKSASGNLDMTTPQSLMEGGDGGEVIAAGDASDSELFRRVTLSQNNIKFMPTKGVPMTYYEMELLKWWLNSGADFEAKASTLEMSTDVIKGIQKKYNVDFSPRPWYEKEQGPKLDTSAIEAFAKSGFKVTDLSGSDNFLEIGLVGNEVNGSVDFGNISENVLILDLKNSNLEDETYSKISSLKNLIRLQLNNTDTDSDDVLKIDALPRLESINLYGTQIDDRALEHLANFPSLKRVYTWQTNVTPGGIAQLASKRPDIIVENGIN